MDRLTNGKVKRNDKDVSGTYECIDQKEYIQHHANTLMTSWQFSKKNGY